MKIATWNVNGIRARQAQLQAWIERERPDVVCLQEIKATSDQVPAALCEMEGYWCYWHGGKGYSGVGLHVSKAVAPERCLCTVIALPGVRYAYPTASAPRSAIPAKRARAATVRSTRLSSPRLYPAIPHKVLSKDGATLRSLNSSRRIGRRPC